MARRTLVLFALAALLLTALALPAGVAVGSGTHQDATPTPVPEEEADMEESDESGTEEATGTEEDVQLVTATVHADLVQPGRVLMSARGNHWVYDSVPPLNGPNEEVNPLDGTLAALISCGMYIYEAVAIENDIPLDYISATVTGELDPRGVAGTAVSPRLRAFHITMNIQGPAAEEAAMMAEAFSQRCPIYTTLARSAPIDVINVVDGEEQEPFATEADPITAEAEEEDVELQLAMPTASGRLVEFGRALLSARGNHWIYDSVPPINGPNEEVNPLDALVGALPACGIMVYEAAARENEIPLNSINATVEADLDPRGVAGAPVNPRLRAFRVTMNVSGPTAEEAEFLAGEYRARCPIYTTFERSAPIEITNVDLDAAGEGSAVLEVDFTYNVDTEAYINEVSQLADQYAAVEGLIWKIWKLNQDENRAGAVYLFEDADARQAYLDSDLASAVANHPALSDFRVQQYDVAKAESAVTHAPLMEANAEMSGADVGTLLEINFTYNVPTEEFMAEVSPLAEEFAATEGLRWKIWALDAETSQFSGVLLFDDIAAIQTFQEGELATTILEHPALSDFTITPYEIMEEESTVTRGPIR